MILLQNFAADATAQLWCPVQNLIAITSLQHGWERNETSIKLELQLKNRSWKGTPGQHVTGPDQYIEFLVFHNPYNIFLNPFRAEFRWENIKSYLYFLSFLNTVMVQLVYIPPHGRQGPGARFNIKMPCQYRKSHCGDKTVVRSSYLHNGISYTGKMSSLYWIRGQFAWHSLYHGCWWPGDAKSQGISSHGRVSALQNIPVSALKGLRYGGGLLSLVWVVL